MAGSPCFLTSETSFFISDVERLWIMGFRLPALRIAATRAERSRPEVVVARMPASAEFSERVFPFRPDARILGASADRNRWAKRRAESTSFAIFARKVGASLAAEIGSI